MFEDSGRTAIKSVLVARRRSRESIHRVSEARGAAGPTLAHEIHPGTAGHVRRPLQFIDGYESASPLTSGMVSLIQCWHFGYRWSFPIVAFCAIDMYQSF